MDKDTQKTLLADYVRGRCTPEQVAQVGKMLAQSEELRNECAALRDYYQALDTIPKPQAPDTFLESVKTRIQEPSPMSKVFKRLFHPLPIKIPLEIAGLTATIILVILIYNPFDLRNAPPVDFDDAPVVGEEKKEVQEIQEGEIRKMGRTFSTTPEIKDETPPPKTIKKTTKKSLVKKASKPKRAIAQKKAPKQEREELADEMGGFEAPPAAPAESKEIAKGASYMEYSEPAEDMLDAEIQPESEEAYVASIIEQSETIVKRKKFPKPEPVDVGLLALSIKTLKKELTPDEELLKKIEALQLKKSKIKEASIEEAQSEEKKRTQKAKSAAPESIESVADQPVPPPKSQEEMIFAQVESKVREQKGTITLLPDKPHSTKKRYYQIEIPTTQFPALKEMLLSEGHVIDNNFSYDSLQVEIIRFNLLVTID